MKLVLFFFSVWGLLADNRYFNEWSKKTLETQVKAKAFTYYT